MTCKTPRFWYERTRSVCSAALLPVSWLYGIGRAIHCMIKTPQALAGARVVCIGNVNAGGSGKTPTALAVMKLIADYGVAKKPAFVSRGYGGRLGAKPVLVDVEAHSAADVGEEALLLARKAGACVYVGRNRYKAAAMAAEDGADVIVLDDGMQNRSLAVHVSLMVLDKTMGVGNGCMIPAGPLREPLSTALKRVDGIVAIGSVDAPLPERVVSGLGKYGDGLPVFDASLSVASVDMPSNADRYLAFCGLGYPQKFFRYLRRDLDLKVDVERSFSDHYAYSVSDYEGLVDEANAQGLVLITTEKDYAHLKRLERDCGVDLSPVRVLPVALQFDDEMGLLSFLRDKLGTH